MINPRNSLLVVLLLVMLGLSAPRPGMIERLDPNDPRGYFDLGEELAAVSSSETDTQRAREVLAMGIGLADRAGDAELAASGCTALAAIAQGQNERAWLWDLAVLLDPTRIDAWQRFRDHAGQSEHRVRAAECLFYARNGDAAKANELIEVDSVKEQIISAATRHKIDPDRFISDLRALVDRGINDDCKGRIFITRAVNGQAVRELCQQHTRPLGTSTNNDSLRQFLLLEIDLLDSTDGLTRWEAAAYLGLEQPMRDPDVGLLLDRVGVDINKPYWRSDTWSARP